MTPRRLAAPAGPDAFGGVPHSEYFHTHPVWCADHHWSRKVREKCSWKMHLKTADDLKAAVVGVSDAMVRAQPAAGLTVYCSVRQCRPLGGVDGQKPMR